MTGLCLSASSGRHAIRIFRLLANREFDFKILERLPLGLPESSDAQPGAAANTIPDFLYCVYGACKERVQR